MAGCQTNPGAAGLMSLGAIGAGIGGNLGAEG